jgi:hypothetical protein
VGRRTPVWIRHDYAQPHDAAAQALPSARIETLDTGYVFSAVGLGLDVTEFEELCRQAQASLRAGAWAQAGEAAARALDPWRGEPLVDVPSQALRDRIVPRLEQLRVQIVEQHAESGLALGQHEQLVAPLRDLVKQYPLRERLHAHLMLALYHGGRPAEALEACQNARNMLVEQLGIEPGPQLRHLHERMLTGDETDLATPVQAKRSPSSAGPGTSTPRQLPAAAGHFTGELEWLTGLPDPTGALRDPSITDDRRTHHAHTIRPQPGIRSLTQPPPPPVHEAVILMASSSCRLRFRREHFPALSLRRYLQLMEL